MVLDAAGYRERRREMLERPRRPRRRAGAQRRAPVELDPMSAQERRVVHEHLKERSGVETYSEGDEPHAASSSRRSSPSERRTEPRRSRLGLEARRRWRRCSSLLARERASVSSVTEPRRAWQVHVDDSLTGLEVRELADADANRRYRLWSWVSGPRPGRALPDAQVDLIESVGAQVRVHAPRDRDAGIATPRSSRAPRSCAPARAASAYDAVTARAVGRLSTLAELASPLLREGGVLVAWKGRRDPDEEAELAARPSRAGDAPRADPRRRPLAGSRNRHLHVMRKFGPHRRDLPRRPGMAKKRPRRGDPARRIAANLATTSMRDSS